jgi:hypothetical protein
LPTMVLRRRRCRRLGLGTIYPTSSLTSELPDETLVGPTPWAVRTSARSHVQIQARSGHVAFAVARKARRSRIEPSFRSAPTAGRQLPCPSRDMWMSATHGCPPPSGPWAALLISTNRIEGRPTPRRPPWHRCRSVLLALAIRRNEMWAHQLSPCGRAVRSRAPSRERPSPEISARRMV